MNGLIQVLFFQHAAIGAFKGNLLSEIIDGKIPSKTQLAIQSRLQRLAYHPTLDFALDTGGGYSSESLDSYVLWEDA